MAHPIRHWDKKSVTMVEESFLKKDRQDYTESYRENLVILLKILML